MDLQCIQTFLPKKSVQIYIVLDRTFYRAKIASTFVFVSPPGPYECDHMALQLVITKSILT